MKIVIAPDSFKGSLTAKQVAESIERGIRKVEKNIHIEKVPMADGGEGTVQSLVDATNGRVVYTKVFDPLMREIEAFYGILGDGSTAIIEMSAASGLPLISKEEKNPLITTTYGTGQLFMHALNQGCRSFIIGIGGSATNDGGVGMMKVLGIRFIDSEGQDIGFGGGELDKIHTIDISGLDNRILDCSITVACDVDNPLCGPRGASRVFGSQKGATEEMVEVLDSNMAHYAKVIKSQLGISIIDVPGAGAAGGLGGGLMAFLKAKLRRGIDIVIDATGLEESIKEAALVVTGEGSIDYQTQFGKTPYGVAMVAKKYGIPVIAIAGSIGKDAYALYEKGFNSIFSIVDKPMTLEEAIENSEILLENTAERIMRGIFCMNARKV
ncbi:glycerate kinase [Desnuesiella massiliensis]|uniref:glycerate kinase n=1 Tax=Desnuesiella massiliensis TaxID=1650662 RepID=UPI0006E22729|nr:glycerate kinase [Desnuesiella massiliensis]